MVKNFKEDLAIGKKAEEIVIKCLENTISDYTFLDVSDYPSYYHKGDIIALCDEGYTFIEVKNDSRIAQTKNILCEEEVFYKDSEIFVKGNMYSDYEVYAIVSGPEKKIYFFDFKKLKEIYRMGEFKAIDHYDQTTYCYLLPIGMAKRAMIKVIDY